jgi:protein required for attachment to host cells
MPRLWVLEASASGARIFSRRIPGGRLELLSEYPRPEGRQPARDFGSDRPGRVASRSTSVRHALVGGEDPAQHAARLFAKFLATQLSHARATGEFVAALLCAGPEWQGKIRSHLDPRTLSLLTTVPMNLHSFPKHSVERRLQPMLADLDRRYGLSLAFRAPRRLNRSNHVRRFFTEPLPTKSPALRSK